MKILNRTQTVVLIVLNAAAVILALTLLCGGIFGRSSSPASGNAAEPWKIERAARSSLNEHILWETNIGGSGDETLVGAFYAENGLTVFGNTRSSDCDFPDVTAPRGFAAMLSNGGDIRAIETFDPICAVTLHEDGYVALCRDTPRVILLSTSGEAVKQTDFDSTHPLRPVDLKMLDSGYAVVFESVSGADSKGLTVYTTDFALNVVKAVTLSRSANLEYLDLYQTSTDILLVANYVSDTVNCLTFVEVKPAPVYHDVTAEFEYTALAVIPYQKGYLAAVVDCNTGFGNLLEISPQFQKKTLRYINVARPDSAKLIRAKSYTYAYFHLGADVSTLVVFDSGLEYVNVVAEATTLTALDAHYVADNLVTFLGQNHAVATVFTAEGALGRGNFTVDAAVTDMQCLKSNGGLLLVGVVSKPGGDCPTTQGGKDLWIAYLR